MDKNKNFSTNIFDKNDYIIIKWKNKKIIQNLIKTKKCKL